MTEPSNEARLRSATLRDLSERTAGRPIWPFVALDWFATRRVDDGIEPARHIEECLPFLTDPTVPLNVALQATVALAAELLGGDVSGIETACAQLIDLREHPQQLMASDAVSALESAGLRAQAINRLKARMASASSTCEADATTQTTDEGGVPRVKAAFVSYSHEADDDHYWMSQVRQFATVLRDNGVPTELDQFGDSLMRDWSVWGPRAIAESEVVLCMASPAYLADWMASYGSGASDEARAVRSVLKGGKAVAFVVLPGRSSKDIPIEMQGPQRFIVKTIDSAGLSELLRALTGQPRYPTPKLGSPPLLPPES